VLGVSRRCERLSLKRCDFSERRKPRKSNPTRADPSPYGRIVARTSRKGRYAASVAEQFAVAKGPGGVSPGGVTIRPGVGAKLRNLWKHGDRAQSVSPRRTLGYRRGTRQVLGGVARTQRPSTLTGEVPRRPSGCRRVSQGHKSTTKGRGDAAERRSPPGRLRPGDGSSPGVAVW